MHPSTISSLNRLPAPQRREIYSRLIPPKIIDHFHLNPFLVDTQGNDLFLIHCDANSPSVELELRHKYDFPDPVLYGHLTDTLNGQIHVLLYIVNDPDSPRFDIDRMPDGSPTRFGILQRNLTAEQQAMAFGLAPGQIRRGLGMLAQAIQAFEHFVQSLGHDLYFAEPLYYHNAILFERHGFAYQQGRRLMERIQTGFSPGGNLLARLDGSTPFRQPEAAHSIRLRSWAIHDGLLGEPFTNVTMYKTIGKHAGVTTCPDIPW
jgi:acetoin utilization protein AcuC